MAAFDQLGRSYRMVLLRQYAQLHFADHGASEAAGYGSPDDGGPFTSRGEFARPWSVML